MGLKERLTRLRKEKKLSQMELAEILKVFRQAVSRWEVGASAPSTENLKCISELYGVSLDLLLSDAPGVGESAREQVHQGMEAEQDTESKPTRYKARAVAKWVVIAACVVALIVIVCSDIENFRSMNDRYGQAWCDRFLRSIAEKISRRLPDLVIGGRIGADVFAFLIGHQTGDWTGALDLEDDEAMQRKFVVKHGVFADVDRELPASALCDRATLALNKIKRK